MIRALAISFILFLSPLSDALAISFSFGRGPLTTSQKRIADRSASIVGERLGEMKPRNIHELTLTTRNYLTQVTDSALRLIIQMTTEVELGRPSGEAFEGYLLVDLAKETEEVLPLRGLDDRYFLRLPFTRESAQRYFDAKTTPRPQNLWPEEPIADEHRVFLSDSEKIERLVEALGGINGKMKFESAFLGLGDFNIDPFMEKVEHAMKFLRSLEEERERVLSAFSKGLLGEQGDGALLWTPGMNHATKERAAQHQAYEKRFLEKLRRTRGYRTHSTSMTEPKIEIELMEPGVFAANPE